jgi:hypothetical protein
MTETESKGARVVTEYVGPEGPSIYANSTEMGFTPWDIRFKLGEIVGLGSQSNSVQAKHIATVLMSPGHAKAVFEALERTIKLYEEKFGEIDLAKVKAAMSPPSPV